MPQDVPLGPVLGQHGHPRVQPATTVHHPAHSPAHRGIHSVSQLPHSVTDQIRHPGILEHRWLAATVLLAGLLLAGGWIFVAVRWRRQARRPGRVLLRRAGLSTGIAVLLLTGGLLAVNSYVGYVPDVSGLKELIAGGGPVTHPAANHPAGGGAAFAGGPTVPGGSQVVDMSIGAPKLGISPQRTYVYLPPGYDDPANARVRYPVVYLIHGYPGSSIDWLRAGRARSSMDLLLSRNYTSPMIIVFPEANGGWLRDTECLNAVHGAQLETYLASTVVQAVDNRFRTIPDRGGRAIGGMSSGAYCALNLGLRHLDTFSVILAAEPYTGPGLRAEATILGGSQRLYKQNSPYWYLPTMRFTRPVSVFLDAGTDDRSTEGNAIGLARKFAARGQYVALRLGPGQGHTWREARIELPYSLVFASRHLESATADWIPPAGRLLPVRRA